MKNQKKLIETIHQEFVLNLIYQKGLIKMLFYRIFRQKQLTKLLEEVAIDWIK